MASTTPAFTGRRADPRRSGVDVPAVRPQDRPFHIDPSRRGNDAGAQRGRASRGGVSNQLVKKARRRDGSFPPAVAYESIAQFDAEID
jgi:hypothetical protein